MAKGTIRATTAKSSTLSKRTAKVVSEVGLRNYARATHQTQRAVKAVINAPSRSLRSQRARNNASAKLLAFKKNPEYETIKRTSAQGKDLADKIRRSGIRPAEVGARSDASFQKVTKALERMAAGDATPGDLRALGGAYREISKDQPTLLRMGKDEADYTFCFHGQAQLDGLGIEYDQRATPYGSLEEATERLKEIGPGFRYFGILEAPDADIPGGFLYYLVFFPEIQSEETSLAEVASNLAGGQA